VRIKKAWIVARKDLSEFRANKQILLTLAISPILMCVMPIFITVPLASLAAEKPPSEPALPLSLKFFYNDSELRDTTLNDAWVTNSTIVNGVVNNSYVNNGTLTNVIVHKSLLDNVTVMNGILVGCILRNSKYQASSVILTNTVVSGTTKSPTADLKFLLDFFVHGVLLYVFFIMAVAMPTTIAAYSFVGEKTNRTLEPLLSTPLTDSELLFGKYLAIFVPVMALILLAFTVMVSVVDVLTEPILGYILLPDALWIAGVFLVTPLVLLVGVALNVLISSKVNDVRTAQQYSALLVVPLMMLFFLGPLMGYGTISIQFMGIIALVLLGVMALLAWLSLRMFNREDILTSWK